MPTLLATKITLLDIFIATMVLKVMFFIFLFYIFRLVKREDDARAATEAPALLRAAPPTKRVAVVACPFCGGESAASVRREMIADHPVYELVCWTCHAALPETALIDLIEPTEWLQRSAAGGTRRQ
jgi:cytochrome c5